MNNSGVRVTRNPDDHALRQLFGQENIPNQTGSFQWDENLGTDEPESFIAVPGKSTIRGSRTVRNTSKQPNAEPDGTPAWMAERKLGGPGEEIKKTNNIVDMVNNSALSQPLEPPTQENSIPEEYKTMMFKSPRENMAPNMNPENPTVIREPRQFPTECIPSGQPNPDPCFPGPNILPPTKQPMIQPTEDMIIKVLGYNETNMKLLGQVSDNIARCTKVLGEINNETHPVDMNSLMNALSFMDATTFRKVLADAFEATLKKNIELSTLISSYINGTAKIESSTPTSSDGGTSTDGTFQGGASADTGSKSEQTTTTPTTTETPSEPSEKLSTENTTVKDESTSASTNG